VKASVDAENILIACDMLHAPHCTIFDTNNWLDKLGRAFVSNWIVSTIIIEKVVLSTIQRHDGVLYDVDHPETGIYKAHVGNSNPYVADG